MIVTVRYNGHSLLVDSDIAESLNLEDGQTIATEKEFWEIIKKNANAMISICEAQRIIRGNP